MQTITCGNLEIVFKESNFEDHVNSLIRSGNDWINYPAGTPSSYRYKWSGFWKTKTALKSFFKKLLQIVQQANNSLWSKPWGQQRATQRIEHLLMEV